MTAVSARRPDLSRRYPAAVTRSVIVAAVRTPFGRLGGGLASYPATELGAHRDPHCARARRARARRGRVRDHGAGAAGRRRPGARAAGGGRRGDPEGGPGGHDQQGVRVVDPGDRDRRPDDPRRRARARRHGRHGVDVERAVPPAEGEVRVPARERRGHRPHGLRRPHVDRSTGCTWWSRRRSCHASSGSRARSRTSGRIARTSARPPRRTPAASTTRSSPVGDVAADEGVRRDTTLERLAALQPVFDPDGTTTAGNARA